MAPQKMSPNTSVWLDVIRSTAAQAVVLGHLFQLFFFGNHTGPENGPTMFLHGIIIAISPYSHDAVMIFFVLSGYLVGGGVIIRLKTGLFSWREYAVNRLSRLWAVLIPCLFITAILDGISIYSGTGEFFLSHWYSMYPHGWFDGRNAWSVGSFLGNAFFVTRFLTTTYGSNASLWSLTNEFWYYLLLPAAILLATSEARRRVIAMAIFLCVGLLLLTVNFSFALQFALGFLIWSIGAAVAVIPRAQICEMLKVVALCACAILLWSGFIPSSGNIPPRHNSCRPDRNLNLS
jgi:peptidoglycan/LPS O-acetylase OafA/YrhL